MSTNFVLTLDTTAPDAAIELNSGDAYATAVDIVAAITSAADDKAQMKVWGDVDDTFDVQVQSTEAASSWITFSASKNLRLASGDGPKTIFVRVRDDVGNVSAPASDAITLDTSAPVPNITVVAAPTKISKIAGFDVSTVTFQVDVDVQAWKIMVVPDSSSPHTAGTEIPTTAGSTGMSGGALAADTDQQAQVNGADLETASPGDGDKIVKIFAQDLAGNWSL